MKHLISLLLVFISLGSYAQKSESFFIGSWKTVDVMLAEDSGKEYNDVLEVVKPGLLKATFLFQANHKGVCKITFPSHPSEAKPSENIYWYYNADSRKLSIKEWKDRKGFVAEFYVKTDKENVFFILTDAPMVLKVKKLE